MHYKLAVLIVFSGFFLKMSVGAALESENDIARGIDAKGILNSLAGSLMSRGYPTTAAGGSQVVSLNLTNLLVLVLLKALIFAAGSFGVGGWKGGLGRSNDEEQFLTEDEILLYLSYLTGSPGDNGCLQSVACLQPNQAKKYISAGETLLKASKMMSLNPDGSYEYVLKEVEQAADVGLAGGDCSRFRCGSNDKQ